MNMGLPGRSVRVLLAKVGLDGHDRGIKVIARSLRDAGIEVVYLGMRVTPQEIARAAIQEDVDVVGISILSGAHMRLIPKVVSALDEEGADDLKVLVGGTIPEDDVQPLMDTGVDAVFPVGTFTSAIVEYVKASARA